MRTYLVTTMPLVRIADVSRVYSLLYLPFSPLVQVKIHYTVEGDTTVIATISANIAKLDFLRRGLPGQPEGRVWHSV